MAVAGVQYRETDTREMDGAWDTREMDVGIDTVVSTMKESVAIGVATT